MVLQLPKAWKILLSCSFFLLVGLQAQAGNLSLVLNGADTIFIEQGRTFTDPGATAYDTANNVINNANVIITGPDTGYHLIPGVYRFEYNYQNGGLAAKEIYRTIVVIADTTKPELTILGVSENSAGNLEQFVSIYENYSAPQAMAYDIVDGDLSSTIVVNSNVSTQHPGTYTVTYSVSDFTNNTTEKILYVIVRDTITPTITIADTHNDTLYIGESFDFGKHEVTYSDNYDLVSDITVAEFGNLYTAFDSSLKAVRAGIFVFGYKAVDKSGHVGYDSMLVHILDTTKPTVALIGNSHDTILIRRKYTDPGVTFSDNSSDSLKAIYGGSFYATFPNSIPTVNGTYIIVYTVTDASGNTTSISRNIIIIDTIPAIYGNISLPGIVGSLKRQASVYLIKFDPSDSSLTAVDTFKINGHFSNFHFENIPAGNYLVKAALDSADSLYTSYLPTYYGNVLSWDSAISLNVSQTITNVNIELLAGTNLGGPGFISGKVAQGANKKEGDPLENIQIILTTEDDKPVAYTYSDKNGYFEFRNLALGTYKLFGEIEGKKALGGAIILTEEEMQETNVEVVVHSDYVKTLVLTELGLSEISAGIKISVFPNPASDKIYIHTNGKNMLQKISVYNMAGQCVQTQLPNQAQNIVADVTDLPNGIYFMEMIFNNQLAERQKIIIAH